MFLATWAALLLCTGCLIKQRLLVASESIKRVITIPDLPREVAVVTGVVGIRNLNVRRKTGIYLLGLGDVHLTVLVVVLVRVKSLTFTHFALLVMT